VKAFAYVNPTNEKEAVAALRADRDGGAMPPASGMDLLARMKDYITQPERIVNVKNALDKTIARTPDGGMKIGAAVKIIDLVEHADVAKMYPAIVSAAGEVGTPQIRNAGTVGGNINQRPRCWYFRNEEFVCYKKGGNRCFAPAGENQFHAIFGNGGPSHIVHPSSLAVPCVAYGAKFRVLGPNGEREVAASEFFTMPTLQNVQKENVLGDQELLTHVILPPPGNVKTGHYEVRYKESHDWPIAFATVVLAMNGNMIGSARVVLGAVAPVPWRSDDAERALVGKPLDEATAIAAGEAAVKSAQPLSRNGYKVQVAKTAVKRAVMHAGGLKVVGFGDWLNG
jgi:xanthine dehydrogenase YagS FAD-binding subunit